MKTHQLFVGLLCGAMPLLYSCSNDDSMLNHADRCSVQLSIGLSGGTAASSRAVSHEAGSENEYQVNNALIIIYDTPVNSTGGNIVKTFYLSTLGAAADGPSNVTPSYYYPIDDALNTVEVGKVNVQKAYNNISISNVDISDLRRGERYYAVAIANFGDLSNEFAGKSLNYLRNYVYKGNLYDKPTGDGANIKGVNNFRMSGINEVSFLWEPDGNNVININKTSDATDMFIVQRLAARLDVSFGKQADNNNGESLATAGVDVVTAADHIKLAVKDKYGNKLDGKEFVITDIHLVSDRLNSQVGTYLIERSSSDPRATSYTYLDNEGWSDPAGDYATKYVFSPASTTASHYSTHSLVSDWGMALTPSSTVHEGQGLFGFINSGYHGNGISTIAYMAENTNSATNYTRLKITGYTNALTSDIFQAPSRGAQAGYGGSGSDFHLVTAEIPIRHNIPTLTHDVKPLENAVVRNTIYRVQIRVIAVEGKIAFRYFYYNGTYDGTSENFSENEYPHDTSYTFGETVKTGGGTGTTPND